MTELPPLLPARRLSWQFLRLAAPYWNSADKWRVRGYTALLLLFTLAQGLYISKHLPEEEPVAKDQP